MPPFTAAAKALEPVVLAPTVSLHDPRDAWIEKVFGPRERQAEAKRKRLQPKPAYPSCVEDNEAEEEHRYREELDKYIAEATAGLNNPDEELFSDSNSDEEDVPVSPCSDGFNCDLERADDYVEPPVDIPCSYRTQDLQGGVPVGGDHVLFTSWAFKRQQRRMKHLRPIPERRDAGVYELLASDEEKGVYTGKIIEL